MLPEHKRHLIGRHCLSLADSQISRRHARLERYQDHWIVEDLGSTNGTSVNRQPVTEPTIIRPGDRVRVGRSEFMFSITPDTDEASDTLPPRDEQPIPIAHTSAQAIDATTLSNIVSQPSSPTDPCATLPDWVTTARNYRPRRPSLAPLAFACIGLASMFLMVGIGVDLMDAGQVNAAEPSPVATTQPPAPAATHEEHDPRALEQSVLSAIEAQLSSQSDKSPDASQDVN